MTIAVMVLHLPRLNSVSIAQDLSNQLEGQRTLRKEFQSLELTTSRYGGWIFAAGLPPNIVWRDAAAAKRLGFDPGFTVHWFNARLEEAETPNAAGRWLAWLEGTAPIGTPFRRALTLYALPTQQGNTQAFVPDLTVHLPNFPGTEAPAAWREHQAEFDRASKDFLLRALIDNEQGAILVAGIAESRELGRSKKFHEWTSAVNAQYHLDLKLKRLDGNTRIKPLNPPRRRTSPAPTIRTGSAAEAGVPEDAKAIIDEFCREWVEATKEPFVTLVAKKRGHHHARCVRIDSEWKSDRFGIPLLDRFDHQNDHCHYVQPIC
jgi:hypothetical protein